MPKASRKRKSSYKTHKKVRNKELKFTNDESEKENLAEINNNIEIIRLTESLLGSDEDDKDSDWEDVSDIDENMDIVIDLNEENMNSSPEVKDEKREKLKLEREKRELIHKSNLLCLIGRIMFINKTCEDKLIQNLALSCLPNIITKTKSWNEKRLLKLVCDLNELFVIVNDEDESGNITDIIVNAFHKKQVSTVWYNVIMAVMLRCAGVTVRLVMTLFPKDKKKTETKVIQNQIELCPPTMHKPSTRGPIKKIKVKNDKNNITSNVISSNQNNSCVKISIELLNHIIHKWIPFNANNLKSWNNISLVTEDYPRFLYCIAIYRDGSMKDVANKYDRLWSTSSRRLRLPNIALMDILTPFINHTNKIEDDIEDAEIKNRLLEQGIPSTLADIKGHPLFVLKSHLLKYEILYPYDVAAFGKWKNEEVYLRDNVKLAHTRETWLKEAMSVKIDEKPCKRVKTLSSNRKHREKGGDPFVDLYGPWQVEMYKPAVAENGIVPRNAFGNVDMFQPSMLPIGCTHLFLKDLNKIATKIDIDCAPAMVGWVYSKRNISRPDYEGWIVCNEHVDILKSAWADWNKSRQAKYTEERQKIVIKRWEILTRRLLLKERLRLEYNF